MTEATTLADYGIVAALDDELTAMLTFLGDWEEISGGRDIRYYYKARVQCDDGSEQVVVCVQPTSQGQQAALSATKDLIAAFEPRHIILVGICGGIHQRGVHHGDILIPERVHYYEPGKLSEDGRHQRGPSYESAPRMLAAANAIRVSGNASWASLISEPRPDGSDGPPHLLRDEMASGEEVWAYTETPTVQEIMSRFDKVIAVENEAAAVFNAADTAAYGRPDVLIIKSAQDLIDNKNDQWRIYACHASAAFALAVIKKIGGRYSASGPSVRPVPGHLNVNDSESTTLNSTASRDDALVGILDRSSFASNWIQLLADGSDVRIREQILRSANTTKDTIQESLSQPTEAEAVDQLHRLVYPLLDTLVLCAILSVQFDRPVWVENIVQHMRTLYRLPISHVRTEPPDDAIVDLWGAIIARVHALGAACWKHRLYDLIPKVAMIKPITDRYWHRSFWARHGTIMLYQAKRIQRRSLCALAVDWVEAEPMAREQFDDDLRECICAYDFIQCALQLEMSGDRPGPVPHPGFGDYYSERTEPAIALLIGNNNIREKALCGMERQDLADAIRTLDALAKHEFFIQGSWDGISDGRILDFLQRYPPGAPLTS